MESGRLAFPPNPCSGPVPQRPHCPNYGQRLWVESTGTYETRASVIMNYRVKSRRLRAGAATARPLVLDLQTIC